MLFGILCHADTGASAARYGIFGNTIDRKHALKSARPQEAPTFFCLYKGYTISENAVDEAAM
jgi:hypothetical protein